MKAKKFALLAVMLLLFLSGCGRQVRFGDRWVDADGLSEETLDWRTGTTRCQRSSSGRSAASRPTCWSKAVWHRPKMQRQRILKPY